MSFNGLALSCGRPSAADRQLQRLFRRRPRNFRPTPLGLALNYRSQSLRLNWREFHVFDPPQQDLVHISGTEEIWPDFQKAQRSFNRQFVSSENSRPRGVVASGKCKQIVALSKFLARSFPCRARSWALRLLAVGLVNACVQPHDFRSVLLDHALQVHGCSVVELIVFAGRQDRTGRDEGPSGGGRVGWSDGTVPANTGWTKPRVLGVNGPPGDVFQCPPLRGATGFQARSSSA